MLSDALSTALFVMGFERARELLASPACAGVDAILVLEPEAGDDIRVLASEHLRDNLELLPEYLERYSLEFF